MASFDNDKSRISWSTVEEEVTLNHTAIYYPNVLSNSSF